MPAKKKRNDRPGQSNPASFGGARPSDRSAGRKKSKQIQARQSGERARTEAMRPRSHVARTETQNPGAHSGTSRAVSAYLRDVDKFLREFKPPK